MPTLITFFVVGLISLPLSLEARGRVAGCDVGGRDSFITRDLTLILHLATAIFSTATGLRKALVDAQMAAGL